MKPFGLLATSLATSVPSLAVARSLKRRTLSKSGAVAAWIVGFIMVGSGLRGFVLLLFYQVASSATKYKKDWKERHDATAAQSSERGSSQVLACSALAVVFTMLHIMLVGHEQMIDFQEDFTAAFLTCAILAHHATCLADTLASELGILNPSPPLLITQPWRTVPPGTNGAITVLGTVMSVSGGALIGTGTALMDWCSGIVPVPVTKFIMFGALCGFIGSFIDSILGATLQATYQNLDDRSIYHIASGPSYKHISGMDMLTNVQVNLISVCITSIFGGFVLGPWIFQRS